MIDRFSDRLQIDCNIDAVCDKNYCKKTVIDFVNDFVNDFLIDCKIDFPAGRLAPRGGWGRYARAQDTACHMTDMLLMVVVK